MKKKLLVAVILLTCFVAALSFFSKDNVQEVKTEKTLLPKPSKIDGTSIYKGENDFWEAEFSVKKNSVNQLILRHKQNGNELPSALTFTLSTAYDKSRKQKKIGTYSLSFDTFPETLNITFDGKKLLQPDEKKLLLKITGDGNYQFFNLYLNE